MKYLKFATYTQGLLNNMFCVIGVFVMNTEEEIEQARKDYLLGENGFEGAKEWNSFVVYEDEDPSTLLPPIMKLPT